jgi:hypothetical protein
MTPNKSELTMPSVTAASTVLPTPETVKKNADDE